MSSSLRSSDGLPSESIPKVKWIKVYGSRYPEMLVWRLSGMYWLGIDRDLDEILRTLNMWGDAPKLPTVGSKPEDCYGFEAFVERATGSASTDSLVSDIFDNLDTSNSEEFTNKERLAQMLLRGAGMLDIDKSETAPSYPVIEYRAPEYKLGQWLRPRAPQLVAIQAQDTQKPVNFVSLTCSDCNEAIQGTYFQCVAGCTCEKSPNHDRSPVFCETCARESKDQHYPEHLRKIHKSCAVSGCMSDEQARGVCKCLGGDPGFRAEQLFPFCKNDRARHDPGCPLVMLKSLHCDSKVSELQRLGMLRDTEDRGISGALGSIAAAGAMKMNDDIPYGNVHMSLMMGPLLIENGVPQSKRGVLISLRDRLQLHPVGTTASSVSRCYALSHDRQLFIADKHLPRDRRVKAFMKQVVGSPFWGVGEDDRVAEAEIVREVAKASLDYADKPMKTIKFNAKKKYSARKRILKKIHALLHLRVRSYIHAIVGKLLDKSIQLEWNALSNNCQKFCDAIIDRNVFGSFMVYPRECKEKNHFSSQVLYLLSFVSRIGCHDGFPKRVVPSTRAAAANGHTEEFLLRFRRFGHHNDTDIIDSLTEYWTDWGGFREPIFRHQGLFPWDCTEARTQKEETARPQVKCGECNLAKHLWAFPFDSWSVAQLHLFREMRFYAPPSSINGGGIRIQIGPEEWMNNRLDVLEAFQVLGRVATAMHRSEIFRASCQWSFKARGLVFPNTATTKLFHRRWSKLKKLEQERRGSLVVRPGSAIIVHDRVKLAGIHRAQPMSYIYEHDMLHDCTLANWADLAHDEQVAAYTALRNFRSEHVDEIIEDAKQRSTSRTWRDSGQSRLPGPRLRSTGWGDWYPEELPIPEGCDGLGAEVDFEGHGTCDCVCDVTAMAGFGLSPGTGGWDLSEGGSGFSAEISHGGFDGGGGVSDDGSLSFGGSDSTSSSGGGDSMSSSGGSGGGSGGSSSSD